jgi:adhesin transport system outer membrane protein
VAVHSIPVRGKMARAFLVAAIVLTPIAAIAAPIALPAPSDRPQAIAADTDVFLLGLAARDAGAGFGATLATAAQALPALGERGEDVVVAQATRDQARSRLFPGLGLDFVGARTIARDLKSPSTQVENLSPRRRNDVIGSVDQLVTDFGATSARVRAGNAASDAALADLDAARNTALMQLVESWYEVLGAQTATALLNSHVDRMAALAQGASLRFERGVDSGGDVARARSYLAAAQSQKINFDRRLNTAEARYFELYGAMAGALSRPALLDGPPPAPGSERPELVSARAQSRQAGAALAAARADRLPRVDARISGSTYDVLRGTTPAYDVRAQLTLRQRFSTGGAEAARVAELAARRRAADLAVDRISAATDREQSTATADVEGLAAAIVPLQSAYLDSRRARDLFAEQFRVSRGTLFDVLRAERDMVEAALNVAQTSYELDVARFRLLARRGGLIEHFGMTPAVVVNNAENRR